MTQLSLAQAIREGAAIRPQCFGGLFEWDAVGEAGSCALGAALEAVTGNLHSNGAALYAFFPELNDVHTECPACPPHNGRRGDLDYIIPHLNDEHGWTRERIAEWIDDMTLEPLPAPAHARRHVDLAEAAAREDVWHD